MYSWKHGVLFLAQQESCECYFFIFDVVTHGIYLSLTLDAAKVKQRDYVLTISYV